MQTLFDKIVFPVQIFAEELVVTEICESDKEQYFSLYVDDELNKWWGYDYREDLGDKPLCPDYFLAFRKELIDKKEEYSLAVKKDGVMIGELVLHNFDSDCGVEMGFRFFKHCQGKGYATKSALALKKYCFEVLGAKTVYSRCFKQNQPSRRLIERLGLKEYRADQTHFYFREERN